MDELLSTALPVAEIIIIKRDVDLLSKLIQSLTPDVQIQLLPYSALFCYEALTYFKKNNPSISIEQKSKYSIKDIRQKAKFFDLGIDGLLQSVINIDSMQNEYYVHLMRFPQLGCLNLHNNLGLYYDFENHIVGNTHYEYYIFQDEKKIKLPQAEMNNLELEKEEIRGFGYDIGVIVASISTALNEINDIIDSDVIRDSKNYLSQDFNTNRRTIFGKKKYKPIRLFLLHVLSSIGFILYCLKPRIIRDTGLLLRLEYITYHNTLKRLDELRNYCERNRNIINDDNLNEMLTSIDYSYSNNLRKPAVRNSMMHFGLTEKDGIQLISADKFSLSLPFCGLIETHFALSYEEYKKRIETELEDLYRKLEKYLGFKLLLKK